MVKNKSLIKSEKVSLFPEAAVGYLLGPMLALIANGVVNTYLMQYWTFVLNLNSVFKTLVPILSSIAIIIGNLLVGRLMERKPSVIGKARPLILLGMPIVALALVVLFIAPFPKAGDSGAMLFASIMVAIGYVLYYAIAWPIYYTSHSALVNLSTRDDKKRGLLGTACMAAQLGASGLAGMVGPFLVDLLDLLPSGETATDLADEVYRQEANGKWVFMMLIMVGALIVGCLLEFLFTRERITEENIETKETTKAKTEVKKVSMAEQIGICVKDKYWWLIIVFFFLYQFGGQMKNNSLNFFARAFDGGENKLAGLISSIGAAPTALGMVLVWPIARKIGKANTIKWGGVLTFVAGMSCFLLLIPSIGGNRVGLYVTSIASFILKALGTAPAMYVSIALMGNVLDHQEAKTGKRTDGFTMAVYGSIMVAMAGVCNGIIVGLNSAIKVVESNQVLNLILAYGVEAVCYLAMFFMFQFMDVEKHIEADLKVLKK